MRTVQSDRDCSAQGLMPGTAQFSTCVLDRQRKGANVTTRTTLAFNASALTYDPAKDVGASEEYYDASFDTKRRREEYSCAQLGLDPGSSELESVSTVSPRVCSTPTIRTRRIRIGEALWRFQSANWRKRWPARGGRSLRLRWRNGDGAACYRRSPRKAVVSEKAKLAFGPTTTRSTAPS